MKNTPCPCGKESYKIHHYSDGSITYAHHDSITDKLSLCIVKDGKIKSQQGLDK